MMPETQSGKRELILLIDDDPILLKLGRRALERAGYRFLGAPGGHEGLSCALRAQPDLILLDYMMPDLSGKEVFQELRRSDDQRLRHTPVIMLTAHTGNGAEQHELLEAGLAAYLCKPFGHHELLNVIENVLVLSRVREHNRILELETQRSFMAMVRTLVTLLFAKDMCTGEHSKNTALLAEELALRCGLSEAQATLVKLGALLHDIGKIGVPEAVLLKPSSLTEAETEVMRGHVFHGERALVGVPHMDDVRAMVTHHHEWWDGNGYPAGLRGEEIPLGARIIAVVDAYDAMTSDRPYRHRLPQEAAVERLRDGAGTQFDPDLVGELLEYLATRRRDQNQSADLEFPEEFCAVG